MQRVGHERAIQAARHGGPNAAQVQSTQGTSMAITNAGMDATAQYKDMSPTETLSAAATPPALPSGCDASEDMDPPEFHTSVLNSSQDADQARLPIPDLHATSLRSSSATRLRPPRQAVLDRVEASAQSAVPVTGRPDSEDESMESAEVDATWEDMNVPGDDLVRCSLGKRLSSTGLSTEISNKSYDHVNGLLCCMPMCHALCR
jgi:hypothetical protein